MTEEEIIKRLIREEVARQLAPIIAAVAEFSRKAQIGFRTIANGAQALQAGPTKEVNYTLPCPRCTKDVVAVSEPNKGLWGTCPACGYHWSVY